MEEDRRVLAIQSHVVHGYVGNRSATFPLQLLGFEVDTINSVQFSNHTGYATVKGQILNAADVQTLYNGLVANDLNHYSHLLTGYIGSKSFLLAVKEVVEDQKKVNPNLIYVCDPVLGDDGKLYVPEELVPVYRESILPLADVITPNQFEAEILSGVHITDVSSAREAMNVLHDAGARTVVISSSDLGSEQFLVCLASTSQNGKSTFLKIDIPRFPTTFTGTGDLFTALLLAWTSRHPDDLKLACEKVVSTMQKVLSRTFSYIKEHSSETSNAPMKHRELRLIQSRQDIEKPQITIQATIL